jgi:hypothetical protein
MRKLAGILLSSVFLASVEVALGPASVAWCQVGAPGDPSATPGSASPDSTLERTAILDHARFGLTGDARTPVAFEAQYQVDRNLTALVRPPSTPASRVELLLNGAGIGANSAGFLGAMGAAAGLWDESTAWALIAAGASVGAIWSGLSSGPAK